MALLRARLIDLHYEWLSLDWKRRYGMGIAFDCPPHAGCRIECWFHIPFDGYPPRKGVRLFDRPSGYAGADKLTLYGSISCVRGLAGTLEEGWFLYEGQNGA